MKSGKGSKATCGKIKGGISMSGPDTKIKGGPVTNMKSKSFVAGKKIKNVEGPDLSGGGWVK